MSTAPRLHKAKDEWARFVSKRPAQDVSSLLLIIGRHSPYSFFRANLLSECLPSFSSVVLLTLFMISAFPPYLCISTDSVIIAFGLP